MEKNSFIFNPIVSIQLSLRVKNFLAKLRKSSFVKNILIVMSGSAVAQAMGFALSPIISRLFSPSDFGIFGSFSSVAGIIAAGVTLQYSQAIMLPKEKENAFQLFIVSCLCTSFVSLMCLICCIILPTTLNGLMKTSGIWVLAFLVVSTIVSGFNEACQAWCIRSKAFKRTSASQVIRSLSSNGMQIGLGLLKAGSIGLIISSILADIFATLNLAHIALRDLRLLYHNIQWKRIMKLAIEYRDFPMYSASMNIINSLSLGLPVLMLTHFYGIAIAGAYAFGMRILAVPMNFVLNALRQVLFQKAAETHNDGDRLTPLYLKITLGLFAISFLPSLILFIWAPQIFSWVFGAQWHIAGEFARSLILWMMFMFCNVPAVLFARIIRIQSKMFIFDFVVLFSRTMVLLFGGYYLSAVNTVLFISIVGAFLNITFIIIVGSILMQKEKNSELYLDKNIKE